MLLIGTTDWYLLAVTYTNEIKFCVRANVEICVWFCLMKVVRHSEFQRKII